jgi:aminoglycoside phosphotransferase (APT) family kinase protein
VAAPEAEVEIDAALVRSLVAVQHPDLADRPIVEVASGWDNVVFRLGDDLAVRLPRREIGAWLALIEQRWLPELAPRLPLPVPAPVRLGEPGPGYPWTWSIVPWFRGEEAALADPTDWDDAAVQLGRFLAALHQPAPADAPISPFRGVPLVDRTARLVESLDTLGGQVDRSRIEALWASCLQAAPPVGPPVWVHGDLHPRNLVTADGRLAAVVDFGDITQGDRATDLSVAWFWLPAGARPVLREAVGGVDEDTWWRAKGWALALAVAHLCGDERVIPLGRAALDAVLADGT